MLTITVLDTATIFEGAESIFRYDLPGSGVVEGWALAGVIEQAAKSAGPAWPGVDVTVLADSTGTAVSDEAVAVIIRHLRMSGVTGVRGAESDTGPATRRAAAPQPAAGASAGASAGPADARGMGTRGTAADAAPARSSAARRSGRRSASWGTYGAIGAALVTVLVAALGGLALWNSVRPTGTASAAGPAALSARPSRSAQPAEGSAPVSMVSAVPSATSPAAGRERVVAGGMSLELPTGYHWTEDDGLFTATGADPNLRVLFAADPLYSVPADALIAELKAQIEGDETLSEPAEQGGRLTYLERPGDGSEVRWTTWVERDQQLSVGCHTRAAATLAHKAACRMASESLVLH